MAFARGEHHGRPEHQQVGVDVMKVRPPQRESFASFIETVGDTVRVLPLSLHSSFDVQMQLTDMEKERLLEPSLPRNDALRYFYSIWTTKEAYTKALGLGLGFDFKRIECDVLDGSIRVDGSRPRGWEFSMFDVDEGDREGEEGGGYVGVAARFVGGEECVVRRLEEGRLVKFDAGRFIEEAIRELNGG